MLLADEYDVGLLPQVLASADDSAVPPGPCRKPPGALYVEEGKGVISLSLCRLRWTHCGRPAGLIPATLLP